jgi:signal transduction histidine kinase
VRAAWLAIATLSLVLCVVSLTAYYHQALALSAPALRDPDAHTMGSPSVLRDSLDRLGLSIGFYAAYSTATFAIFGAAYTMVGLGIFLRRPHQRMALLVSLWLVVFGTTFTPAIWSLQSVSPALYALGSSIGNIVYAGFFLLFYVFPDGRFVPRWTRWTALLFTGIFVLSTLFPGSPLDSGTWGAGNTIVLITLVASMLYAQVYRYRRVSGPVERQQTKWVVFGLIGAVTSFFLMLGLIPSIFPVLNRPGPAGLLYDMVGTTPAILGLLLVPLSIGVATLRYRLWDIDVIINRALVYGGLTLGVVGIYALVVGELDALLQGRGSSLLSLLAAGLIAVVFAPLRERLQRRVNRLTYGERDDPYRVISRLGERLEAALAPDEVLPTIVQTVREALKLPYAAIAIERQDGPVVAAAAGREAPALVRLPLVYQGEVAGELLLGPRTGEEAFSGTDLRLLSDLARQAGIAVHAVRLTADLQRSRETLVTAREEERRRLRRDLHDGLGPALAAQTLKVGVARAIFQENPDAAERLMTELEADIDASLANIRRLVYALRPPSLDELGLVGALREVASAYSGRVAVQGGADDQARLRISVEAPEALPCLPAAVEVAVYRIVQEALTNVVRHAKARHCSVRIRVADAPELVIEVEDDGVGLPPDRRAGVGLSSMRERARELGGSWTIESPPRGGTRVSAHLPLPCTSAGA